MSLKSCLCLSFRSDKIPNWQNVLDLIMIGQNTCYSWVHFTLHMFDLAWFIHWKYKPNKMRHTLTPLSNHCKFQEVPGVFGTPISQCRPLSELTVYSIFPHCLFIKLDQWDLICGTPGDWRLIFQRCRVTFVDGSSVNGCNGQLYSWRRENGLKRRIMRGKRSSGKKQSSSRFFEGENGKSCKNCASLDGKSTFGPRGSPKTGALTKGRESERGL